MGAYFPRVSHRSRAAKNDAGCGSARFFAEKCQRGKKTVSCLSLRACPGNQSFSYSIINDYSSIVYDRNQKERKIVWKNNREIQ